MTFVTGTLDLRQDEKNSHLKKKSLHLNCFFLYDRLAISSIIFNDKKPCKYNDNNN